MALNPFDDAVETLAPAPQAPAGGGGGTAVAANPYDQFVEEHRADADARLRMTAHQASAQTPDRAAEARKYADRFGLPPSVVEGHFDAFKQRAALEDVSQVGQQAPALGAWLAASPSNAAIAQDDHAALSALERTLSFARRALGDPAISLLKGAIGLPEAAVGLADIVTGGRVGQALETGRGGWGYQPELAKAILSTYYSKAQAGAFQTVSEADGALATAVAALSHPSVIAHSVLESLPLMLSGAAAGVALPFLSPAIAGAVGEGAAQAGSAAEQSRAQSRTPAAVPGQITAGNVDLFAQPKVPNADGSISTVDSVGVNVDGQELLLPTVTPDGRHFTGTEQQRVDQAIAEYKKTGRHLGVFATPEASTAYAEQLHADYAAGTYDRPPQAPGTLTLKQAALAASSGVVTGALGVFGGQLAQRLGIADVETLLAGGAVSQTARRGLTTQILYGAVQEGFLEELPQSISEQVHQNLADGRPLTEGVNEAAVLGAFAGAVMGGGSQVQERMLHSLGETAKTSKTIQRSPEAAEAFLAQATKDGPLSHVYAPIDTFTTYWQGQGLDPAQKAAELTGDPAAYQAAVASGEDLAIPTSRYTVQVAPTEHHAFFTDELRTAPDQMNVREAKAFETQFATEAAALTEPAPVAPVRQAVLDQLTAAGVPAATAAQYATLYESTFGALAAREGLDPLALYSRYGLEVARPDLQTAATASTLGTVAAPAAESTAVAPEPTAAFLGFAPNAEGIPEATYRVQGGPQDGATATIATLAEEGIAPPAPAPTLETWPAAERGSEAHLAHLERRLQAAERAAEIDPLTGVASRAALDKALPTAEADPDTAVVMFDANNFGQVNKQLSHDAGDAMLRDMAAAIQQAATEAGVGARVFRRGGDEFVVLAPTAVAEQVRQRAETLFGAKPAGTVEVSLSGNVGRTSAEADATLQAVKAARKRAPAWAPTEIVVDRTPATPHTEGAADAHHPPAARQRPADRRREQLGLDPQGLAEKQGDPYVADSGGLPAAGSVRLPGLPDIDEVFTRQSPDVIAARLTPPVTRELARILDEMETFPFVARTWTELGATEKLTGNAAGGHANIVGGSAGAAVYDDILAFSPVNLQRGKQAGKPAKQARGTRGAVLTAIRTVLETNDVPTNLAEGVLRVAEHRAAGDLSLLSPPELPHRDAIATPPDFVAGALDDVNDAIDHGEGDPSFDPTTFNQGPKPPIADVLPTGEQQPRLPGAVGDVRTQEVATPAFEAPFSLTSETPKALKTNLGKLLFQPLKAAAAESTEPRGALQITADRQVAITLFAHADLSTFLHESGHFFLEVLTDLAARPQASPQITADVQALRGWLFPDGDTGQAIGTPQHEQFARGFEAYLMEGKAPSVELRSAFSSFRAWLLGVYRSLTALKVTLTPEVRQVFDRMLATDRAIAEAEASGHVAPMFTTAESAGMTAPEFARYAKRIADASRMAREELEQTLMAEVRRTQTAMWAEQRQAIEATVTDEIHAQPIYRALAAMQRGTQPDGAPLVEGVLAAEPMKLSKAAIVAEYGKDRLPSPTVLTVEGGLHPDAVAEAFGFSSGDELLTTLAQTPPRTQAIQQETDRRMLAAHGSLLLDGTLAEQAQAAVANEGREHVVREEIKALQKLRRTVAPFVGDLKRQARGGAARIRQATPSAESLRTAARDRIAGTIIKEIRPAVFWSASRKAAQAALDHAARQEVDAAIAAHTQQLISLALYREATRAKEDVAIRVAQAQALGTGPARQRLGLAGETYLDQVDGVLDRYQFAAVSQKALARRASVRAWLAALEGQGQPVDGLPEEILNDARRVHYTEVSYQELVGVTDGLQQIAHLARLKNKLLKSADARDFAVVRDGLVASIREHHEAQPVPLEFRPSDQKWRKVSAWFASHTKLAILARALDGHVDGGPVWEAIIRPINAAADAEETRKQQAGNDYGAIVDKAYPNREVWTLNHKTFIPAIGTSLSKEGALAIALNWGNQTSRDRVLADPVLKVNAQQVQAILDTLDARDWAFVQETWDYLQTYWPEIAAKQQRVTGIAPEKVEALPVVTKFGDQAGGYYPLAYDSRKLARAGQHVAATEAKLATSAAYVRTTTKRGHVETRLANVTLPIRLELGVAFQHLDQVIHDLTHHEMLVDTTRLVRDGAVAQALYETKALGISGDVLHQQFTSLLQDLALGSSAGPGQPGILDGAASFLRTRTQIAGMGWNLWTALQQPLGLFNGMSRVGPGWVAKGLKRWLRDAASMESTAAWIADVSPMMRHRVTTATQDLHDLRRTLQEPGGWFDAVVRTVSRDTLTQQTITDGFLWHIGIAQRVADIPTWLGGYEKAMAAGHDEARAIALADQGVLDSQGGGQIKDLAQVQRGGPVAKLFMTFYSYGSTVYNATAEKAGATDFTDPASVLTFLGHLSLIAILPAVATEALRCVSRTNCTEWPAFVQSVGGQILGDVMNMQVGLRELAGSVKLAAGLDPGTRGYEGPAALRPVTIFQDLAQQLHQGKADAGLWHAANAAAGILFRYPAGQVQRTVDGWVALQSGRTQNPAVLLFGPPKKAK